jgi:hypothetical protein
MITVLVKMVQNKSRKKLFKLYRLIARQVGKSALFYFKCFRVFILRFTVYIYLPAMKLFSTTLTTLTPINNNFDRPHLVSNRFACYLYRKEKG